MNWHEEGADAAAVALLDLGIGVEAGLWHAAGVDAWTASQHRDRCLRQLIELPDRVDAAAVDAEATQLLGLVAGFADQSGTPLLLHGEGTSTWRAVQAARELGLSTRIGLEDTLELPDGSPAAGNVALVRAARQLLDATATSG